jgi:tight adherence protein B
MLTSFLGNSFIVVAVLVFIAVLLLLEGLYVIWQSHRGPEAVKLRTRLQALSATRDRSPQTQLLRQRMLSELPVMERYLQSMPRMRSLDRSIVQSGLNWTVSKLLLGCAATGAVVWLTVVVGARQSLLVGAVAAVLFGVMPLMYVKYKKSQRLGKMERQLPEALDLIIRALRAGHAFSSALKMTGEDMAEPIAGEFRTVHDEVNFGVSLQQALTHLSERVPLTDLRYFVVAVLIQRESGGNLTEILANLSRLIRERLKLLAKVRVLSAEGRMSAWVLGVMPFVLAGLLNVFNPDFMRPLWQDPIGIGIVKYMLGMMLIGAFVMRKIIKIRV